MEKQSVPLASSQPRSRNQKPTLASIAKGTRPAQSSSTSPGICNEQEMDQYLESKGFWRKSIAKDGSCLFRVVAEEVYNTQSVHPTVRKECIQFMRQNPDMFSAFVSGPFDHYLFRMQNLKEWGGQLEIVALSKLYSVDFIMFQHINADPVNVTSSGSSKTIRLCYSNGNHYDIIYPKRYKDTAALLQNLLDDVLDKVIDQSCRKGQKLKGEAGKRFQRCGYRNVELEVYDETKRVQQFTDHHLASKLQLQVKDECTVLLRDTNLDDGQYHRAVIESVITEGDIYQVYVEELQDSVHVPFEDIELANSYQDLSGYYRKGDNKEDSYKVQSGRKRRTPRNRVSKGKHETQSESGQETREQRQSGNFERGSSRGRRSESKRQQNGVGLNSQGKGSVHQVLSSSRGNDSEPGVAVEPSDIPAPTIKTQDSPAAIVKGSQKDVNETAKEFWGRFHLTTQKSVEQPHAPSNGMAAHSPAIQDSDIDIAVGMDVPITSMGSVLQIVTTAQTLSPFSDNTVVDELDCYTTCAATNIGANSIRPEPVSKEEIGVTISEVDFEDAVSSDVVQGAARAEALDINSTGSELSFSMTFDSLSSDLSSENLPATCIDIPNKEEKLVSKESSNSRRSNKKSSQPRRILKRDIPQNTSEAVPQEGSRISSPRCPAEKDVSIENLERKEKKVSFAEDIKELALSDAGLLTSNDDASAPDAMNGSHNSRASPSLAPGVHQLPLHTVYPDQLPVAGSMMSALVPPNQQLHGIALPQLGYFSFSVDPEGKDLPKNATILQHFYNCGIKYLILEQQQHHLQQQQQMHMTGQYVVNPLASSNQPTVIQPNSYVYSSRPGADRSTMLSANMYNPAAYGDGSEYVMHYSHQQHQPESIIGEHHQQQPTNDGRPPKEYHHGRSGKKQHQQQKMYYDSATHVTSGRMPRH